MELPDDLSFFWGAVIHPDHPCKIKIPKFSNCALTNVSLESYFSKPLSGRTTLYISVNESEPISIVSLTFNVFESTSLDIQFDELDSLVFTVQGDPFNIHISGYITGSNALVIDNGDEPETINDPFQVYYQGSSQDDNLDGVNSSGSSDTTQNNQEQESDSVSREGDEELNLSPNTPEKNE